MLSENFLLRINDKIVFFPFLYVILIPDQTLHFEMNYSTFKSYYPCISFISTILYNALWISSAQHFVSTHLLEVNLFVLLFIFTVRNICLYLVLQLICHIVTFGYIMMLLDLLFIFFIFSFLYIFKTFLL